MGLPLVTMAVAQFFDLGTFLVMVRRHGPGAEANPLIAGLFDDAGVPGVALAKIAVVVLVVGVVLLLSAVRGPIAGDRRRLAGLVTGLGIAAGLVGGVSNAMTLGPL